MTQRGRVAEPGPVGDRVHRLVALLQQLLGQQDALPDQPALRRGAGVLYEPAGEGPLGHVRPGGQLPHGQRLIQVLPKIPEKNSISRRVRRLHNIPLTAWALKQGGYDWGFLAFTVGLCLKKPRDKTQETMETMQSSLIALRERMNKRQTWVRADKLQPGDRVQDTNGNIVTIKDVNKGLWPGSILITLRDASAISS